MSLKRSAKKQTRSTEHTKGVLLEAAKKLFARRGLYGTTVQQIADEAGVNISMISHHFGGKEELYRACLLGFGEARLEALSKFLKAPESREEFQIRLEMLIEELFAFHLKHADVTAILLRDVNAQQVWGKQLEKTLFSFTVQLSSFFAAAKERGLLRSDVDPLSVAALVYFSFSGLIQNSSEIERNLPVSIQSESFRKDAVKRTLAIIFYGILV